MLLVYSLFIILCIVQRFLNTGIISLIFRFIHLIQHFSLNKRENKLSLSTLKRLKVKVFLQIKKYRCIIPECEPIHSNVFQPDWIKHAIPYKNGHLDPCHRYKFIADGNNTNNATCNAHNFNKTLIISCRSFTIKNHGEHVVDRVRKLYVF